MDALLWLLAVLAMLATTAVTLLVLVIVLRHAREARAKLTRQERRELWRFYLVMTPFGVAFFLVLADVWRRPLLYVLLVFAAGCVCLGFALPIIELRKARRRARDGPAKQGG